MEKSTIYGILIFVIIIGAGLFMLRGNAADISGGTVNDINNGEIQKIILSEKNLNYFPNELKVSVNQPVSITLDSSVKGCLRSFNIKELGVSKYAKTPAETIDFTSTKKGTFTFSCSMGMGYGKLIVE